MHTRRLSFLPAAAAWLSALPAQPPPLAPTSHTTISTAGSLHYSSILIPAGVTVQFTGTAPAVVLCDGDCIVHGTLSAAAIGATDGPGAVTNGIGSPGAYCASFCSPFGCHCWGYWIPGSSGVHHGAYGSAIPFSLLGGSPGGSQVLYWNSNPMVFACCDLFGGIIPGGGGGGTLVVIAGGSIYIGGVVDVRGGAGGAGSGSAGSLLLRGVGGTVIRPGGQLLAGPASASGGVVRLDAWGSLPLVQGPIVAPPPVVLALPHLRASSPPVIGTTWSIDVFAPASTFVFLAASTQGGASLPTPFGTLEIDLSTAAIIGVAPSGTGHDPNATIPWVIPHLPQLIGLQLWLQGLAWPAALPPRLTNTISATVQ